MVVPTFTFDSDMNGYVTEPIAIDEQALVHIELEQPAPVVTLKREKDGGYANYGMTPAKSDRYEINITLNKEATIMLATPVAVTKCWVLN